MTEPLPVNVSLTPRPFSLQRVDRTARAGTTIAEIMEEALPDPVLRAHCHVELGGYYIPRCNWRVIKPKAGTYLVARVIPAGGSDGKNPLATILMVAVIAASIAFGPELGATLLGTSLIEGGLSAGLTVGAGIALTNAIGTAIIGLAGTLLINALVPIKPPSLGQQSGGVSATESPTLFITGAQNRVLPFGVIPRVFGRVRMTPPLGAKSYTEIAGNDQYLRVLLCWGYGPLTIEDIRIGETPITSFQDVVIEHRQGFENDAPLSLFPRDVNENPLTAVLEQKGSWSPVTVVSAPLAPDGAWHQFTTAPADRLELDFNFPLGCTFPKDESSVVGGEAAGSYEYIVYQPINPAFEVQFSPIGAGQWFAPTVLERSTGVAVTAAGAFFFDTVNNAGEQPFSFSLKFAGIASSEFDIRVRRLADTATQSGTITRAIASLSNWSTRTSAPDADELSIDLVFPQGLVHFNDDGSRSFTSVIISVEYRLVGTTTWIVPPGGQITVTDNQTSALRSTLRWAVSRGQYEVRLSRFSDDPVDNKTLSQSVWSVLRTFTNEDPIVMKGVAKTALRIRATDQLSGEISQLNGIVQAILPDWDEASQTWITRATSSPAAAFRATLQGSANKRPLADERLGLDSIEHFAEVCFAAGREYNRVHDFQSSVWSTLNDICAAGRASPKLVDGKWGVVVDEPRVTPVQHFTPRNSWGFQVSHLYPTRPHGLRIRFINEDKDFGQDERIVYDDGYSSLNAKLFEQLEFPGITNPQRIWEEARFHIAVGRLRPNQYQLNADVEHIVCTRGDRVLLSHDVLAVGQCAGRVKSVTLDGAGNVVEVEVDEECVIATGTYAFVFRVPNVGAVTAIVSNIAPGTYKTLPLANAVPAAQAPAAGDLFSFGLSNNVTLDCLVLKVQPSTDLSALLTLIDYSPAVYDASKGPIPEYTSLLSDSPGQRVPVILSVRSNESVLLQLPTGTLVPRILVSLGMVSERASTITQVELQYRIEGTSNWKSVRGDRFSTELAAVDVIQGMTYELRLRFLTANGPLGWTFSLFHSVVGMATPPADVPWVILEGKKLRWSYPSPPIDLAGFKVRSLLGTTRNWQLGVPAHENVITTTEFDATAILSGTRTIMVKAVDQAGNESLGFAFIEINLGDPDIGNIVLTNSYAPTFNGFIVGGTIVNESILANGDGGLYLVNSDGLYLGANGDPYLPVSFQDMTYDADYLFEPNALRGQDTLNLRYTAAGKLDFQYRQFFDDVYLPKDNDFYLPVPSSQYLPPGFTSEGWLAWPGKGPIPVDPKVIGLRIRTHFSSDAIRGELSKFDVLVDTPDLIEFHSDQNIAAGGTRLPLDKSYRQIVSVHLDILSGSIANTVVIVDRNPVLGPLVEGRDGTGAPATAIVDYTIKGY